MIRWLLLGSLLGLVSGVLPGPFSAFVVATSLQRGFGAASRIALMPLASETTIMFVTALTISRIPQGWLRWLGVTGGIVVLYLAWRTWQASRERGDGDEREGDARAENERGGTESSRRGILQAALLEFLTPAPWVFWLFVASPLVLGAWRGGWERAFLFMGAYLACLVGVHLSVALLVSRGRKHLGGHWRRRLLRGAAGALVLAAGMLVWQAWVGNFEQMVRETERVQEIVDEARGHPGTSAETGVRGIALITAAGSSPNHPFRPAGPRSGTIRIA
jgi:threonine/homoserine/homoserine lactone efflux protein